MRSLRLLLALCGALAVAACGVKGPLEPPPGAHAAAPPPKQAKTGEAADGYTAPRSSADFINSATPQADWQKKKSAGSGSGTSTGSGASNLLRGVERPNQPFVLDGLL